MAQCLLVRFNDGQTVSHKVIKGDYSDPRSLAADCAVQTGRDAASVRDFAVIDDSILVANGVKINYNGDISFVDGVPVISALDTVKRHLKGVVDVRTGWLISRGFEWDSKAFSMDINAQSKWNGLYSARSTLAYPVKVSTRDDDGIVSLASDADVESIYNAAIVQMRQHVEGGSELKQNIHGAEDEASAMAAFSADNRQSPWGESPPV